MGDWEQPSTSLEGGLTAKAGGEDPIELLRKQVAAAVVRIASLEQRVSDLENRGQKEQAHGA
jgi:hypothetical protein